MKARTRGLLIGCTFVAAAIGCSDRPLRPINPCTVSGVAQEVSVVNIDQVDLLFMIDNSNSMASEQALLRLEFPRMVRGLVLGDPDPDDAVPPAYPPTRSLRVGVISSDLGVNGVGVNFPTQPRIPTCGADQNLMNFDVSRARYGDDGALNVQGHSLRGNAGSSNNITETDPLRLDPVTNQPILDCEEGPGDDITRTYATMPAFLTFDNTPGVDPDPAAVAEYAQRVSCFTHLGTGGCGFEQQLESLLKAMTPSTREPLGGPFFAAPGDDASRALGRGDDPNSNGAWFREDALLAIVMVTDEDDCSSNDPIVFDYRYPTAPYRDPANTGDPTLWPPFQANTRCARYPELLFSVDRYVQGILAMRSSPRQIVFAAITGVPPELTANPLETGNGRENLQAIVNDARMTPELIAFTYGSPPNDVTYQQARVKPVCTFVREGVTEEAVPATRIVQVASGLHNAGANVLVQSICQQSFSESVKAILTLISEALVGSCLPRAFNRNASYKVLCDVVQMIPAGMTCASIADRGVDAEAVRRELFRGQERDVCRIQQLPVPPAQVQMGLPPEGLGWYYDDHTAERLDVCTNGYQQRIAFTAGAEPIDGAELSLECVKLVSSAELERDVNSPCTQGGNECQFTSDATRGAFTLRYNLDDERFQAAGGMFCEYDTNTCQIPCDTNADCPGGFVCYDDPNDTDDLQNGHLEFCVNPTCGSNIE